MLASTASVFQEAKKLIHTKTLTFKTLHAHEALSAIAEVTVRVQDASAQVSVKVNPILRMRGSQQPCNDKAQKTFKAKKARGHFLKHRFSDVHSLPP